MAPLHLRHVDPPRVRRLLSSCLHDGCRGATLSRTKPGQELIEVLTPSDLFPQWSAVDHASAVEQLLLDACEAWGAPRGDAALLLVGLSSPAFGKTVTYRRELAADVMAKSGEAFRRKHERAVLEEVAFETIRLAADLPYADSTQLRLQLVG